jgi:hypothetical protein
MLDWLQGGLIILGFIVAAFAISRWGAQINWVQAAMLGAGLLLTLVALKPDSKIAIMGNSFEPLRAASVAINAGDEATKALARRLDALEARLRTQGSPNTSDAQKRAAIAADKEAREQYIRAAAAAERARRSYLEALAKSKSLNKSEAGTLDCSIPGNPMC